MKMADIKKENLTPMVKQYVEIKEQNQDIIVFFRLGDFYEMFFEDAILVSKLLEITLTSRNAGLEERIPMCGVPHHAANIYIEKLVEMGYRVGICEQLEEASESKTIVKRDIVKIISKGTITDDNYLYAKDNNYIGSLTKFKDVAVIAYADISTGDIFIKEVNNQQVAIINEIINIGIKELIVTNEINKELLEVLTTKYNVLVSYHLVNEKFTHLQKLNDQRHQKAFDFLLSYIENTQKIALDHLKPLVIKNEKHILKMDVHTKRNLELIETKRLKQRQYSLLWLLDKTKTAMGGRLLKQWLENPIIDEKELNNRYDYVEKLISQFLLRSELEDLLTTVYDLERLSGKVAFGNCKGRDLLQLKKSLKTFPLLNNIFKQLGYPKSLTNTNEIFALLEKAIDEDAPISVKEGGMIKSGYNAQLDELKKLRKSGKAFVAQFEISEREKTGIKNLKVGYNRVFGYYIEVSKGNKGLVKDEYGYERKQTLSNCERYISPLLKEKEAQILNAEEKIVELEYELFGEIRQEIKKYIRILQQNSDIISEIDVLSSLAIVAEENDYVRPELTNHFEIIENRHPIIEKVNENGFVPNDILLKEKRMQLITGPNMSGKSTYIRQFALSVIMAQMGCFVPASEAKISVVDAIFTRIGSSDDLVSGESTFMVEMQEANFAIKNATEKSLILFDELGRGTATFDGIALTQAIIEYIHNNIGTRAIFSTHYHELTDLEKTLTDFENIHVSAIEENGELTFLYKIKPGSVDKSYGIHVAKLAKLPVDLINRASDILTVYEQTEIRRDQKINKPVIREKSILEKEISELDLQNLTPLEGLNLLYKLQKKVKED